MTTPERKLVFHTLAEKKPGHEQEILYVKTSDFYETVDVRFGTVDYQWSGVTDDTCGSSIMYSPDHPAPGEGFELACILDDGTAMHDTMLWCPVEALFDLVDAAEGPSSETVRSQI